MGPNWKLRRPFIWQDEMTEVRELFRRVDRVRNSGFTGFSTWESPPPSADTLSRNRLRRRRALCSVELSHLNYKEAPFESLNHLQNIRGMCTRIQRQDYPMERKKKDVDLISRPPLLRRPITSISVERRCKRRPFEVRRPYSASPIVSIRSISRHSTRDLGLIPLQYATPKLTTLYDITQKSRSTSRTSTHKSFNILPPTSDQYPTTSSKIRIANNYSTPCIEREKPSCIQPISNYCSETRNCFESKNNSRHSSPSKTPILFTKLEFDNLKAPTYHEPLHKMPSTPPLNVNHINNEGKPSKMKEGYNTTFSFHEMNLIKDQTCLNDMENSIENQASNYNIASNSTSDSTHSTLVENLGFIGQSSTLTTESRWLTTPRKSSCKSPLHLEVKRERIGNYSLSIENDEDEQIINQETTITGVDDPNVLIKHSSDPYSDFRLSMVTMIEEEGLQDRQAELEELFQYYLDLNPKVHHDVLHKVIQDIRTNYLLKTF